MKAILLDSYGDPSHLKLEEVPAPQPGPGELLVKIAATSVNPIDYKIRSGEVKGAPPKFPAILGRDLAGEVTETGPDTSRFRRGDRVLALANQTYAEFCTVKEEIASRVPEGLSIEDAGALPLILTTGTQLVEIGVKPQPGETVLVTGALGSVGRTAVHVAKQHGARVIAGVRTRQKEAAASLGADAVVAIDNDDEVNRLEQIDAIADTVAHGVVDKLLPHLRPGGRIGSVLMIPDAAKDRGFETTHVTAQPDAKRLEELTTDVAAGRLKIPIAQRLPLAKAAEAQQLAEAGVDGKVLLLVG